MPKRTDTNAETKYRVIVSDPPWRQTKGGKKKVRPNSSGKSLDYQTMSLQDIAEIQTKAMDLAEENHILFLWTIEKFLPEAENMLKNLGYRLHARMIWNKVTGIPSAFTIRYGHEYLLYCYKEKLVPVDKKAQGKIHSVFTEQVKKHSQKPDISYQIIEQLYPNCKKLEMYARGENSYGWDVYGNEAINSINL